MKKTLIIVGVIVAVVLASFMACNSFRIDEQDTSIYDAYLALDLAARNDMDKVNYAYADNYLYLDSQIENANKNVTDLEFEYKKDNTNVYVLKITTSDNNYDNVYVTVNGFCTDKLTIGVITQEGRYIYIPVEAEGDFILTASCPGTDINELISAYN